ncbi:MAG: hypothetical protein WC676_05975 [Candidatus Omnitrophota bacterium]
MFKKILIASSFIVLIVMGSLEAEAVNSTKANAKSPIANNVQSSIHAMTESKAYELLYNNSKESNDRLMSTTQWACGFVAGFILLVLGTQIFFNYRIGKQEIDNIKNELEKRLTADKSNLLENINKANKENERIVQQLSEKAKSDLKEIIDSRFTEKIKLLETEKEIYKKDIELIESRISTKISNLAIDLEGVQGHVWNLRGVKSNAITRFIDKALLQIKEKIDVKYTLKEIHETLENLSEIHESDFHSLEDLMKNIPEKYDALRKSIDFLFKKMPIYKFVDDPKNPENSLKTYVKK